MKPDAQPARDRALNERASEWLKARGIALSETAMLAALLHRVAAEARREEAEVCAKIAETYYTCQCDEAYKSRNLVAPDCFKHQAGDDIAAEIREAPRG